MPALVCAAHTCVYNKEEYCSKGDIKIGGQEATDFHETCCASFEERTGEGSSNSIGTGSLMVDVNCKACNCVYNETEKCCANKIGVAGSSACEANETACGTFCCH
jgi:Domain of Unknown Function (DUF1540).